MTASADAPRRAPGRPARHTPDELLALIAREFLTRGYDATTMEHLAQATGMTKSSIYHHVASKEQLLQLAVSRALDALFAVLDEPQSAEGPAVDRLQHVVRRSAEVLDAQLPYVSLLLRIRGNTPVEREALARRRDFDTRLSTLVQSAIDQDGVRADLDPRLVTRLLFGMVNSVAEWYRPGGSTESAQVADAVVALAFDGLRRPRS